MFSVAGGEEIAEMSRVISLPAGVAGTGHREPDASNFLGWCEMPCGGQMC